jgi:homocysteine S-methyltransferase
MLSPFLERQPFLVLDGGLATELERRGAVLRDPLWSARLLLTQPELIRSVHLAYFEAGADVAVTASYQAAMGGLTAAGLSSAEAERLLRSSVDLAIDARAEFMASRLGAHRSVAPLVAGSIGPYGAFLHDGSEYHGGYGRTSRELARFHQDRFDVLAATGADLLAFETIPSRREAEALVELLERRGGRHAWISFTAKDERRIADGTPFADCVASVTQSEWILAVGINCTAPRFVAPLLETAPPARPFVVYPNTGEVYDARSGDWHGHGSVQEVVAGVERWHALGARLIGGCCRTTPDTIREIRSSFEAPHPDD